MGRKINKISYGPSDNADEIATDAEGQSAEFIESIICRWTQACDAALIRPVVFDLTPAPLLEYRG